MINFTTPRITLIVEEVDIVGKDIYVSMKQDNLEIVKTGDDLTVSKDHEDTVVVFMLSQEESASFSFNRSVAVQVNWIDGLGIRCATEIKSIPVMRNLLDEVIAYGN